MYSVIIPTKDRLDCFKEALQSVLNQTLPAGEIIVIDDGSQDQRCGEWIRQLGVPGIRYVYNSQPRGGAAARNQGLDLVSGHIPYVAFLDDDDIWLKNKMERQTAYLEAHPDCVATSCHWRKFGDEEKSYRLSARMAEKFKCYENFFGSFSFLTVRRARTDSVRITPGLTSCQDWDYIYKLSGLGRIHILPEILCRYRVHGGPRITTNAESRARGFRAFAEANHFPENARNWIFYRAAWIAVQGDASFWRVLRHATKSLFLSAPVGIKVRYAGALLKSELKQLLHVLSSF